MPLAGGGGDIEAGGEPGGSKVHKPRKQGISRVGGGQQNTTQLSQIWKVYIGLGGHTRGI